MDHADVGKLWDGNAGTWTRLSRLGYDLYRDKVNTPAFLAMLPEVSGLRGVDIGCGEGSNTRILAALGARMTAFDIAKTFVRSASTFGRGAAQGSRGPAEAGHGLPYLAASAVEFPFRDASFDFAAAFMSLMDMPDQPRVVSEVWRVLKPGGFLQFSISHPCFFTPRWQWLRDEEGRKTAVACGDYFHELRGEVEEWTFGAAPPELREGTAPFRVPRFTLTLSHWLNLLLDAGFRLERLAEPTADEALARECPYVADTRIVAYFLILRFRKEPRGRRQETDAGGE